MQIGRPQLIFILLVVFLIAVIGCSPKLISLATVDELQHDAYDSWDQWRDIPGETSFDWQPRTIRTAVHYFDTADSSHHWDQDYAVEFAAGLISSASERLSGNVKMNLPEGNNTPTLNGNIKLDLDPSNVYFHYTDEDAYFIKKGPKSNRYNRKMVVPYVKGDESMIHIFIMPFDPEEIASGRQKIERTGIALSNTIKLAGIYEKEKGAWHYAGLLSHEVGHVLGLRHTWNGGDGCKDTPHHDNCWNTSDEPPCDGIVSNNLMDYNVSQSAMTPCQINIMHANISNPVKMGSRIAIPLPCIVTEDTNWNIQGDQRWNQAVDVPGNITITSDATLYLSNYISMASDGKIIIKKGGTLLLDGPVIKSRCSDSAPTIVIHKGGHVYSRKKTTILKNNPLY